MQVPEDGEDLAGQSWYHGPLSRQVPLPPTAPLYHLMGVFPTLDLVGTPGTQMRGLGSRSIGRGGWEARDYLEAWLVWQVTSWV